LGTGHHGLKFSKKKVSASFYFFLLQKVTAEQNFQNFFEHLVFAPVTDAAQQVY